MVIEIDSITRTEILGATSATPVKVQGWTSAMTTVTMACDTSNQRRPLSDMPDGAPIVTVSANVPYRSLFSVFGFATGGLGCGRPRKPR